MLNETMTAVTTQITSPGIPWWIQVLALLGVLFLLGTVMKTGINIVYGVAYIYGFIKFLKDKWRKK